MLKTRIIQNEPTWAGRSPSIIEVDGLSKDYGSVRAVDRLSFSVSAGTITGFLGANGSGKTTTLRVLLGLVAPTEGNCRIDGRRYRDLRRPLSTVGSMLEATTHPARTARNHLAMLAAEAGASRSRVGSLLELVELDAAADRRVGGFSLGMRQRLGLAGALMGDPAVLVLDEPANGLDPEGIRWLREFLRGLAAEGRTILLSSHVLAEVAQTVDDIVVIKAGRLVTQAPLDTLLAAHASHQVRVRTAQPDVLVTALAAAGFTGIAGPDGAVVVTGCPPEQIGRLALERGLVLSEITDETPSLEDTFLALTTQSEEIR